MDRHITAPFNKEVAAQLKAGDYVYIWDRLPQERADRLDQLALQQPAEWTSMHRHCWILD